MATMVKAKFKIESVEGSFEGFHDPGNRWNGWAKPKLTRKGAKALCKAMPPADDEIGFRFASQEGNDWLIVDEEVSEMIPEVAGPNGETLYDMGDLGLCWLEEEEQHSGEK